MADNPTRTVTNPRIAKLIALEVAGKIKPEHQQELDTYRAMGMAPKKASGNKLTENESKSAGFYERAQGANRDFEGTQSATAPRGLLMDSLAGAFPKTANAFSSDDRQKAEQAKRDFISASLRYESGAAIGKDEFTNQDTTFFPQPGDSQDVIQQKANARERVIESLKTAAGTAAPTEVPKDPVASQARAVSKDGSSTFSTEKDESYAKRAQALFNKGGTRADLDGLAVQYGYGRYGADLDGAIKLRDKGDRNITLLAPASGSSGPTVLGAAAASPVGAAVTGAANAITGGTLDEIVGLTGGDQAKAQAAKEAMRELHPTASVVGEVGGGVLASLGVGRLASAALPAIGGAGALSLPSLAGDAAYSGLYGAGENNDNRVSGGVLGALAGAAGGAVGRGVLNRFAGAVAPQVAPEIAFLRDNGVRLTPGQALGPTASRLEEKLVSIPGTGDLIRSGRQRALDDFNTGYLNDALSRIGAKLPDGVQGTAAMAHGQQAFNDAYEAARSGMSMQPDAQLVSDLTDLSSRSYGGELTKDSADRLADIYHNQVVRRMPEDGSAMDGDAYKTTISQLGKLQASTKAKDPELSNAIAEMGAHIENAARRSSPADAVAAMDAADEGYALYIRGENAAAMRGGDTGTFTPTQLDAAVQKGDGSVRSRAYLRGDALGQDWADAGKSVLRDVVPNSGTVDRMATGAALGGLHINPAALIPAGVLSAAYAPGVRDVLSNILMREPSSTANALAGYLRLNAPLGGATGVASSLLLDR